VEFNGQRDLAKAAEEFDPIDRDGQEKMAAEFDPFDLTGRDVPVKMVAAFDQIDPIVQAVRIDLAKAAAERSVLDFGRTVDRMAIDFPTVDPMVTDSPTAVRGKAATANVGTATTGAIGLLTTDPIEFRIAIGGINGAAIATTTAGNTGTAIGAITVIGTTAIGGIATKYDGRTPSTSTTGAGPPGRPSLVGSTTVGPSPCTTTMAKTCTTKTTRYITATR
jgi:hypothetical protein